MFLHGETANDNTNNLICQWKGGKLKTLTYLEHVLQPSDKSTGYEDYSNVRFKKMSGDRIYFSVYTLNSTIGNFECTVPMKYDGKKLKREGREFFIKNPLYKQTKKKALIAKKDIPLYYEPDGKKSDWYFEKGHYVTPDKFYIGSDRLWFRVVTNDDDGDGKDDILWIRGVKSLRSDTLFKDVPLAG